MLYKVINILNRTLGLGQENDRVRKQVAIIKKITILKLFLAYLIGRKITCSFCNTQPHLAGRTNFTSVAVKKWFSVSRKITL